MHNNNIKHIAIVGGGSSGWLTAGVIAAEHQAKSADGLKVTVIESPNIPPIGVGEGSWPTLRTTLAKMGVSETDFFRHCDASFKQGIKFCGWVNGGDDDCYYHPLELPRGFNKVDLVSSWQKIRDHVSFADAVCFQNQLCERNLGPKQISTPEYAAVANYAYHFDSSKLGKFLTRHCTENLGVNHIMDDVVEVLSKADGDIKALQTKQSGLIHADLFVDCSGSRGVLIEQHYKVPYQSKKHIIFNDTALAVQVPYINEGDPIASHTIATAQKYGWIWDIGLPTRRGVGHVYASEYTSEELVSDALSGYLSKSIGATKAGQLNFRKISYVPGHRAEFWHRNCVAIGMSAGFVEPLEATALVMIEAAATMLSVEMPASRVAMDIVARRFNERFHYYWDTTIDFLKLQYVLTQRKDSDYWRDNVRDESIPDRLKELLFLWRYQVPNRFDFPLAEEMLPAASWQYILYGMGFTTEQRATSRKTVDGDIFGGFMKEVNDISKHYIKHLPTNRELIDKINQQGLPREHFS